MKKLKNKMYVLVERGKIVEADFSFSYILNFAKVNGYVKDCEICTFQEYKENYRKGKG